MGRLLSAEGFKQLDEKIKNLQERDRKETSKNGEILRDCSKLDFIVNEIVVKKNNNYNLLEKLLNEKSEASLIEKHNKTDLVDLGDKVSLSLNGEIDTLVLTGNYNLGKNQASVNSPLGKAIYKKKVGTDFSYKVENEIYKGKILVIEKEHNLNLGNSELEKA